jgi:hypothetical protein
MNAQVICNSFKCIYDELEVLFIALRIRDFGGKTYYPMQKIMKMNVSQEVLF